MNLNNLSRRDKEAEYLNSFEKVIANLERHVDGRGNGSNNKFDPGFDLVGKQRFQFGDFRIMLDDRIVLVEVESGGGLTNLVKYWPLAQSSSVPILLLHAFGQSSTNDYISHLHLWNYTWKKMQNDLWQTPSPMFFARKYQFLNDAPTGLTVAAEDFRRCLMEPLEVVCQEIFAYNRDLVDGTDPNT